MADYFANPSPLYIGLIQIASALPFFLLALSAGSIGNTVDRRRLIFSTETWMFAIAVVLAATTIAGAMTPWLLLLALALSLGDAIKAPTGAQFSLSLSRRTLSLVLALNGIEFNLARAVGPGLSGLIIAAAGKMDTFRIIE